MMYNNRGGFGMPPRGNFRGGMMPPRGGMMPPVPGRGGMQMMAQPMRPPMPGMPPMTQPPMAMPIPPPVRVGGPAPQIAKPPVSTIDSQYAQQFLAVINSADFKKEDEDGKKTKIGDFIYTYVEKLSSADDAPKITGMIIDLDEKDLIESV